MNFYGGNSGHNIQIDTVIKELKGLGTAPFGIYIFLYSDNGSIYDTEGEYYSDPSKDLNNTLWVKTLGGNGTDYNLVGGGGLGNSILSGCSATTYNNYKGEQQ